MHRRAAATAAWAAPALLLPALAAAQGVPGIGEAGPLGVAARLAELAFLSVYMFFLPGYLLSRRLFGPMDGVESLAMGLGMSLVLVPVLSFSAALLVNGFVTRGVVLATATALVLAGGLTRERLRGLAAGVRSLSGR